MLCILYKHHAAEYWVQYIYFLSVSLDCEKYMCVWLCMVSFFVSR